MGLQATFAPLEITLRSRDDELDVLGEQIALAKHGRGSLTLIEGRAGFGKTRLLDEAETMGRRSGLRTGVVALEEEALKVEINGVAVVPKKRTC